MKTYVRGVSIKEKKHNNTKYKIKLSFYVGFKSNEDFRDLDTKVSVKMKFLCFWITIWKEYIFGSEFKNIDDYNDEIQYSVIKADDILDCLTF